MPGIKTQGASEASQANNQGKQSTHPNSTSHSNSGNSTRNGTPTSNQRPAYNKRTLLSVQSHRPKRKMEQDPLVYTRMINGQEKRIYKWHPVETRSTSGAQNNYSAFSDTTGHASNGSGRRTSWDREIDIEWEEKHVWEHQ